MSHGSEGGNVRRQERQHSRRLANAGGNVAQQIRALVENSNAEAVPSLVKRALPGPRQTAANGETEPLGLGNGGSSSSSSGNGRGGSVDTTTSSVDQRTTIQRVSTKSTAAVQTQQSTASTSSAASVRETTSSSRSSSSSSVYVAPVTSSSASSASAVIATSTMKTSSNSVTPLTSVAYVTSSALPTNNAAASTTPQSGSNSIGAGPIVGIVAGSLAGIAILAVLAGFLIKKMRRKEDPFEANPFDRDEFRRQSIMLDDGQDGAGYGYQDYQPPMSDMHHGASYGQHGGYSGYDEYGNLAAAGAAGAAGGAAAGSYVMSQDGNGRPRPPTMFQRHLDHQASFNSGHEKPSAPTRMRSDGEIMPQLPEVAFGGSDPYSLAGVGRHNEDNINNPYGYLDRRSPLPRKQPNYGSMTGMANDAASTNAVSHDTAGRPGTSEGRSGTPDLPNMQQTYALGGIVPSTSNGSNHFQYHGTMASGHSNGQLSADAHHSAGHIGTPSPPMYDAPQDMYEAHSSSAQQPSLQVRNQQRPFSAATEGDENAAYGGVW